MNSSSKIKFHLSFFFILSIFLLLPLNIYGKIKVNNGKVTFINESGKVDELIKKTAKLEVKKICNIKNVRQNFTGKWCCYWRTS